MSIAPAYSEREESILLADLKNQNNIIKIENIESLVALWPGLCGQARNARSLFERTKALAKLNGIEFHVAGAPKRERGKYIPTSSMRTVKSRTREQILGIIQGEIRIGLQRATIKILRLMETIAQENIDLKEEIKNLRPYKNVVETSYRKELSNIGGTA